ETVPDEDALFHRLDVDVARLALDRALHHQVDEIDDRRRFAALLEAGDRLEDVFFDAPGESGFVRDVRRRTAGRGSRALAHRDLAAGLRRDPHRQLVRVADVDGLVDVAARRDHL